MLDSKSVKTFLGVLSFVAIWGVFTSNQCAIAQIQPDTTLGGNRSVITPRSGDIDFISGGATRGANLFHSFEQFSLPTGRTAFFNNSSNIQNIISRVTGRSASFIDGLLQARGTANLFLLNPNGIIFGPNATLSIGGSFLASTADSLPFADGTIFSASSPQATPLLTVSVPIGLQFTGNPGRILVQGDGSGIRRSLDLIDTTAGLRVQPNQTLALIGGDVALEGATLKTAGGNIELGSVSSPSLVSLTSTAKGWSLGYEGVQNFRDINLSRQTAVDASGRGGGNIQVQSKRMTLSENSQVEASTLRSQPGGTVNVTSSEFVKLFSSSDIGTQVYPGATGSGGNVNVKTSQLLVQDGSSIASGTLGDGEAGLLTISAQDSVKLTGTSADNLQSSGLFTSTFPGARGDAGSLNVETRRLIIRDRAGIFSGTFGEGAAGSLTISAQESIELTGTEQPTSPGQPTSAIATTIHPGAIGAGGDLTLRTRRLLVRDGAVISTANLGTGPAGNFSVIAKDSLILSGTSVNGTPSSLSARSEGGNAGSLTIETMKLTIQDGAVVTSRNDGARKGGALQIDADSINLDTQGGITASTTGGDGGNISLLDLGLLVLRRNSEISATAGGTGAGGNVTIDADVFAALEDSDITANAFVGEGGNIEINTQGLFTSFNSDITASSQLGIDGTVKINTENVDFAKATAPPVTQPENPRVSSACQARSNTGASSLTTPGAGGLPAAPTDVLGSQPGWNDSPPPEQGSHSNSPKSVQTINNSAKFVEAQGWKRNPDGTVSMTTTVDRVVPYSSFSTPACQHEGHSTSSTITD